MAVGTLSNDEALWELREQLELQKHINTYQLCADGFKWKEWGQLFTEDTVFEFKIDDAGDSENSSIALESSVIRGQQDTVNLVSQMMKVYSKTQHVIVNANFDITRTSTATGNADILFFGVPDATKPHINDQGGYRYTWRFRKTEKGWRTTYTQVEKVWDRPSIKQEI